MNYGEIITSAFRITLRNRYLWFFGFFVGLGSGGAAGGGGGGGDFDEQRSAEIASIAAVQQGTFDNALQIIGLALVGLLILLGFFALYVVSQGGLTESVAAIDGGEERRFSSTWRAGARNFWPVLWQILLFVGIVLGLVLAVGIPVALLVAGAFVTDSTALRVAAVIVAVLVAIALLVAVFVLLPLLIVALAVLGTFNHSYWTLAYLRLTNQGGTTRP